MRVDGKWHKKNWAKVHIKQRKKRKNCFVRTESGENGGWRMGDGGVTTTATHPASLGCLVKIENKWNKVIRRWRFCAYACVFYSALRVERVFGLLCGCNSMDSFMFICLHSITTWCSLADNQHCCCCCSCCGCCCGCYCGAFFILAFLAVEGVVARAKNANYERNDWMNDCHGELWGLFVPGSFEAFADKSRTLGQAYG